MQRFTHHSAHRMLLFKAIATIAVIAALALALGLGSAPEQAYASPSLSSASGTQRVVYYPKAQYESANWEYIFNRGDDVNIETNVLNLKSSNPKVLTASIVYPDITIVFKKAGTARVSYTYQDTKHVVKYIVKKYANPLATLKIGKKGYAGKFKNNPIRTIKADTFSGKLTITPAKNWKLKKAGVRYLTGEGDETRAKAVKSGTKIKDGVDLYLTLKNKKTKIVQKLVLGSSFESD